MHVIDERRTDLFQNNANLSNGSLKKAEKALAMFTHIIKILPEPTVPFKRRFNKRSKNSRITL